MSRVVKSFMMIITKKGIPAVYTHEKLRLSISEDMESL